MLFCVCLLSKQTSANLQRCLFVFNFDHFPGKPPKQRSACRYCGKLYVIKGRLRNHMKDMCPKRPKRDRPCIKCGKRTTIMGLRRHMNKCGIESDFQQCPVCPFPAIDRDALKKHVMSEHQNRPKVIEIFDGW